MVRKKRVAVKDAGDAETIEPSITVLATEQVDEPKVIVEGEPKVALLSSEETAWKLLDNAPAVPYIVSVEDAVKFVDEYKRWMRDVKGTKR